MVFTDEWGGGTRPRCRATDQPNWGANAIFDIVDRKLRFASYYKLPAPQTEQENCVAHNGSLIPVPGRDIMVQAWYQGGVSVLDFTDSAHPMEIAFFDRGPIDAKKLITGGLLVLVLVQRPHLRLRDRPRPRRLPAEAERASLAERDRRGDARPPGEFNPQQQPRIAWPANAVVARAYLDQLVRSNAIAVARASALRTALDKSNRASLVSIAGELEKEAASTTGVDASRLRALAATLKALR